MSAAAPPILAYAAQPPPRRKRLRQIVWLGSALPAAVAPFIDFTYSTSPLDAVASIFEGRWNLDELALECAALAFFIAFPVLLWRLRRLLFRSPGKIELRSAAAIALLCNVPALILLTLGVKEMFFPWPPASSDIRELISLAILVGGIAAGAIIAYRSRRTHPAAAVEALMLGPYLANAGFCLLAFYTDPENGYWITAVAVAAFGTQLLLIPASARAHESGTNIAA